MFHHHGMHGYGHRRRPMFEKGALKYLILDLISAKPRHGYDIIRELEELSGGCYSPSPGSVYPTLQMLEDLGHIAVKKENGKKIYELTDEGRAYLAKHKDMVTGHRTRMTECFAPTGSAEFGAMMHEMKDIFHLVAQAGRQGDTGPKKAAAIKDVLDKAKGEIENIIQDSPSE